MEAGAAPGMMGPMGMMDGPMLAHGGAFEGPMEGGQWANEFGAAGPMMAPNPMMQQAWAEEMMMQEAALRSQHIRGGAMGQMMQGMPMGAMAHMMGGAHMKGAGAAMEARALQMNREQIAAQHSGASGAELEEAFANVSLNARESSWGEEFAGAQGGAPAQQLQRGPMGMGGMGMGMGMGGMGIGMGMGRVGMRGKNPSGV